MTNLELRPIGVVRSALRSLAESPRQGNEGAPRARLVLAEEFATGLERVAAGDQLLVLTWLHAARRDVLRVHPRSDPHAPLTGVFATRSPDRPNPIGLHRVEVLAVYGRELEVAPLEAIDGTPIVDLKPVIRDSPHARHGFHSITPRIVTAEVEGLIAFLRAAFDATGELAGDRPAEINIGDSVVLVSSAGAREAFPAFIYVYVADAEVAFRRAIAAGAAAIEEPFDTGYGDRRAMIRDPFGNVWQIAHVIAASSA